MSTDSTQKPFHESIVGAINRASSPDEFRTLGELIKGTKIPKDHDNIADTWTLKANEFGLNDPSVAGSILAQKPGAEAAAD